LLLEIEADIESRDVAGKTLLFNTAISGSEDLVNFLCKLGAKANVGDGLGDFLLHRLFWNIDMGLVPLSALSGDSHTQSVAMFQQLLKYGADPLLRTCNKSVLDTLLAFEPPRHSDMQKILRDINHKVCYIPLQTYA
jgi:ankyrin repeat protein